MREKKRIRSRQQPQTPRDRQTASKRFCMLCASLFAIQVSAWATADWSVVVPKSYLQDEAIAVSVEDLNTTGKEHGLTFALTANTANLQPNVIFVGSPQRNPAVAELAENKNVDLQKVTDEQGYEIKTLLRRDGKTLIVNGGSILGDIYGLYWIWDRLRVYKDIPQIDTLRKPTLQIRHPPQGKGAPGRSKRGMRSALRYGLTWVTGENPLNLIPWDSEPEKTRNAENRKIAKEMIDYAHALHLKYFTYGDEFTFHPSFLEKQNAKVSVADPAFWGALQEKYRTLLHLMPEIDGVGIRTGESTMRWGNYIAADVMHQEDDPAWNLERRYTTFVRKLHDVVVGEFDKLYYHRTWVTSDTEQHTNPEVFKKIFTSEVPQKNLFLEPKITLTDRWYYQPYNPTFNLTPHKTLVEFEAMEYHTSGRGLFASFPGQYFQGGLRTLLSSEDCNVIGAGYDVPNHESWGTWTVNAYTLYRLTWNPEEDLRTIAEDFAAIHFGREAAERMGDIYLLSASAYKDGMYIKPAAEARVWNTLPQLRNTTFPMQGIPEIDRGKTHLEWLESTMYEPCRGREEETLRLLDRGLSAAERMRTFFKEAKPKIANKSLAEEVEDSLDATVALVRLNNLYVQTCLAYFEYRSASTSAGKTKLAELVPPLQVTREELDALTKGKYRFYGIDQLRLCAEELVADREGALDELRRAPTPEELDKVVTEHQARYAALLESHKEKAVKFLHWEGSVDGKDLLLIQGNRLEVKHLQSSQIAHQKSEFSGELPKRPVTVIVRDLDSRPRHPFVLEQPKAENDYTARIYLEDSPGGQGWCKFDLYTIPDTPEDLGLVPPWEE